MRLTLNILEDEKLRKAIKDAISGQVKSVARDEIVSILKGVLEAKLQEEIRTVINEFKRTRMDEILFEAFDHDRREFQRPSRDRAFENMRKEISEEGAKIMKSLIESKYPNIEADIRESLKKSIIERLAK